MHYVLQNKLGSIIEYAVLTATSVYFTGDEWGVSEADWTVVTTDVVEDATKFYSEQAAFNMLAWIDDLPEGCWKPVKVDEKYTPTKTQIAIIADKLAQLKLTLNLYSDNLSLEQYDHLHADIEELQYLVLDLEGSMKEPSLDGGLGVDWVRAC